MRVVRGRKQDRISKERALIKRKLNFSERGRDVTRGNRSNKRRCLYTYPAKPRAIEKSSIRINESESEGKGSLTMKVAVAPQLFRIPRSVRKPCN